MCDSFFRPHTTVVDAACPLIDMPNCKHVLLSSLFPDAAKLRLLTGAVAGEPFKTLGYRGALIDRVAHDKKDTSAMKAVVVDLWPCLVCVADVSDAAAVRAFVGDYWPAGPRQ